MNEKADESDVKKRRDAALRRALNTPPKPKTSGKNDKNQSEKENGKEAKR